MDDPPTFDILQSATPQRDPRESGSSSGSEPRATVSCRCSAGARSGALNQQSALKQRPPSRDTAQVSSGAEASCVARINELLEQWHAARRVDEAKVRAAQARTDAVLCCCQEQRERQEAHHAGRFDQTRGLAERSVATQEEKVKALAELSEQRVAMMQRQSRERRRMAEQRLEELQQHIEDQGHSVG